LAFVLALMPWPEGFRSWHPNFVLLVTLYWLNRFPESIGVGGAWWLGLIYDGVSGSPLGLHALSFTACAAVLLLVYPRWRLLPMSQKVLLVVVLLILEQIIVNNSQGMF
jgi:rod shape-determining protein MreD